MLRLHGCANNYMLGVVACAWRMKQVHSKVTIILELSNIYILITYNSDSYRILFFIKENIGVILGITLTSTNQRPLFIHCSDRFQTILIICRL